MAVQIDIEDATGCLQSVEQQTSEGPSQAGESADDYEEEDEEAPAADPLIHEDTNSLVHGLSAAGRACIATAVRPLRYAGIGSASEWLWVDIETSGTSAHLGQILEIAMFTVDSWLTPVKSLNIVVHHDWAVLGRATPFCQKAYGCYQHGGNDLFKLSALSVMKMPEAAALVADFAMRHYGWVRQQRKDLGYCRPQEGQRIVLAGSSPYLDREFLLAHVPVLRTYLHYQVMDVTCLRTALTDVIGTEATPPALQRETHRAMEDLTDSLQTYQRYSRWLQDGAPH